MKRLTGLLLGIVLVVGMAGMASADTQGTVTLKVSCVIPLSILITQNEYNFGQVSARMSTISTDTITVSNNSQGRTEDYTINCDTATTNWNIKTSDPLDADEDMFSLQALFMSTQAGEGDFSGKTFLNEDEVDSQNMDIGFGTTDYTGDSVPAVAAGNRNIWFRLHTPGTITSESEQSISVTITANPSGTFGEE